MDKKNNSLRGFTLVELLAVIVVLAIVMLIALQAVLPAMENARKQTFAIEANGAIDAANTYFINSSLTGDIAASLPFEDDTSNCVTIETLRTQGFTELGTNYEGKVVVTKKGSIYLYEVYIQKDRALMVNGAGNDGRNNVDIDSGAVFSFNASEFYNTSSGGSASNNAITCTSDEINGRPQ